MENNTKTREQLLKDLEKSNKRIAKLEKSLAEHMKAEKALKERDER